MAYYAKPKQLSFTPNSAIIKSSGAIGDELLNIYKRNYTEQQNQQKQDNWEKTYDFGIDKFEHQKQQDDISNAYKDANLVQAQNKLDYSKTRDIVSDGYKNAELVMKADKAKADAINNKSLNNYRDAQVKKIENDAEQKVIDNQVQGLYVAQNNPILAQIMGVSKPEYQDVQGNDYISRLLGKGREIDGYKYDMGKVGDLSSLYDATVEQVNPKQSSSEYITLLNQLNDPNIEPEKKEYIKQRITKLSQPDMNSKEIDYINMEKRANSFANALGLENRYQLATVDVGSMSPEMQAQANELGQMSINALRSKNANFDKNVGNFEAQQVQTQTAYNELLKSNGDIRFVDETVKKVFSNYFGLSESEMQSTEATQAMQSALNIKILADSGKTVTANEMQRQITESMSPYMHKDKILLGLKNMTRRQIATLDGFKRSIGQVPFNLKYGAMYKNYNNLLDALGNTNSAKPTVKPKYSRDLSQLSDEELIEAYKRGER